MTKSERIDFIQSTMQSIGMTNLYINAPYSCIYYDTDAKETVVKKIQDGDTYININKCPSPVITMIYNDLKKDFN